MVAAVAGIVLLVVRKVQVSKEEEKERALRVQHQEEERKLRGPVEEIQKTMEEASKEASRIEQETKHFLEQYQMVPGEKDPRT